MKYIFEKFPVDLRAGLLPALLVLLLLPACGRQKLPAPEYQRMPAGLPVTVARFSQPTDPAMLIMGRIPEKQGLAPENALTELDMRLRHQLLTSGKRQFSFRSLPGESVLTRNANDKASKTMYHSSSQPQALANWLEYGNRARAEYLLVPQVMDWHEREGSRAGVTKAAHVRIELFLINVKEGRVASRAVFEEEQIGLTENLLNAGSFLKRRGSWVTASELASDGIQKTTQELGL